ncbi:hypothetical protein AK812_SmicGene29438 [Symbiodinium microadriaticum]|uniref:Uncharacterized protein n=1 Tax=Symbiodinium microadriaticum TaxID=2951 RepID=A0A1Q9D1V3_SYMMI|nr:hypothetical protein AK812_SmicGene29438 [Symbiodinium microadriaticum]CAE7578360.1 unnamed protein product [Symbiodinium microadriaticum]CAE7906537.1 unnamed protein product [Symbiodinium sp. KB8]
METRAAGHYQRNAYPYYPCPQRTQRDWVSPGRRSWRLRHLPPQLRPGGTASRTGRVELARDVLEEIFLNYTMSQWGTSPRLTQPRCKTIYSDWQNNYRSQPPSTTLSWRMSEGPAVVDDQWLVTTGEILGEYIDGMNAHNPRTPQRRTSTWTTEPVNASHEEDNNHTETNNLLQIYIEPETRGQEESDSEENNLMHQQWGQFQGTFTSGPRTTGGEEQWSAEADRSLHTTNAFEIAAMMVGIMEESMMGTCKLNKFTQLTSSAYRRGRGEEQPRRAGDLLEVANQTMYHLSA